MTQPTNTETSFWDLAGTYLSTKMRICDNEIFSELKDKGWRITQEVIEESYGHIGSCGITGTPSSLEKKPTVITQVFNPAGKPVRDSNLEYLQARIAATRTLGL